MDLRVQYADIHGNLREGNGGQLNVLGSNSLPFVFGGMRMNHTFIVASGINKNVIIRLIYRNSE